MGRFISADAIIAMDGGFINMYSYCSNNPVIHIDSRGYASIHLQASCYEGRAATSPLEEWEEMGVEYQSNGPDNGGKIVNSYIIRDSKAMTEYILQIMNHPIYEDDIAGTLEGVFFEWQVHNVLYDVGVFLGSEEIKKKSADVDFGKTIYDDEHGPFNIFSSAMWGLYYVASPNQAQQDLTTYLFN